MFWKAHEMIFFRAPVSHRPIEGPQLFLPPYRCISSVASRVKPQHGFHCAPKWWWISSYMYRSSDSLRTRMSRIRSILNSSPSISSAVTVESAMETTSSAGRQKTPQLLYLAEWSTIDNLLFLGLVFRVMAAACLNGPAPDLQAACRTYRMFSETTACTWLS